MRVIVESPYNGGLGPRFFRRWLNVRYARRCMLDSLQRGEAPFLSHLLYPQVLDEDKPGDREIGIRRGLAWAEVASMTVVYTDRGITIGMKIGIAAAKMDDIPVVYRSLKGAGKDARSEGR